MKPVLLTSTLLGLLLASCSHQYTDSSQDRYTPQVSTPSTSSQGSNETTYSSSTDVSDSSANHHYDTSFSEPSYTQSRHAYSEPAYCPPPARHHHSTHSRRHHNTHRPNKPTRKQKELIREQLRNAYKH